jgi:hypothetical protein
MRIEVSTVIAAPAEAIWPTLSGVTAWPEWLPTVTSVEALGGAGLAPGARFLVKQPRLRPAVWVVTDVVQPLRFRWESRSPGALVVGDHSIAPLTDGESQVTLGIDFSGFVGSMAGWFYASLTRSYVAREADALKQTVESGTRSRT